MGILILVIFMYYLNVFFVYSILGHLLETFIYMMNSGESGILYGFWTPVYGIGCIIIISCYQALFQKHHLSKKIEALTVFLIGAVLLTFIEWIGGILIEIIFGYIFWDYSHFKFHIGPYIAWEMALIWGLASLGLIFFLKPMVDQWLKKIPLWVTILFSLLFMVDVVCTILFKI